MTESLDDSWGIRRRYGLRALFDLGENMNMRLSDDCL